MKNEAVNDEESFNPYQAPKAKVADSAAAVLEPVFFAVSPLKLALMSIVTFGLYEIYWFYRNWKFVQRNREEKLNAPIRALFYPLTAYALFRRIRHEAASAQAGGTLQAGLLAIAVLILAMLWRLPDPWWLVSFLGFIPLLSVQATVNELNRKLAPGADPNARFTGWNIVGLIAGGLLFILSLIGAFLPE